MEVLPKARAGMAMATFRNKYMAQTREGWERAVEHGHAGKKEQGSGVRGSMQLWQHAMVDWGWCRS